MSKPKYIPGQGPFHSKLMILGDFPDEEDTEIGSPFSGKIGDLLDEICRDAGFHREQCYVTTVIKHLPPGNDIKRISEINVSLEESVRALWAEIHNIRPNCIIALGDIALEAVTSKKGITKYRGSILPSDEGIPKIVAALHPKVLVTRRINGEVEKQWPWIWRSIMILDYARAWEESKTERLDLPNRYLKVARNYLDVHNFLHQNRHLKRATADIESYKCLPTHLAIAFNKYEALSIPLFNKVRQRLQTKKGRKTISSVNVAEIQLANYTDYDKRNIWQRIDDFFRQENLQLIGQNFKYDQDKLEMVGFRFPNPLYADTMLGAHTINPEMPSKGQAFLTSTLTREPYYKDEYHEYQPGKDDPDQIPLYNAKDAAVDFEIFEVEDDELSYLSDTWKIPLRDFYYNYVVRLHELYLRMENRGIRVDENARAYLKHKYDLWHEQIQCRFRVYLGHELNVNSWQQVGRCLYEELKCPLRKGTNEDVISGLLANVIKDDRRKNVLSDILEDRRVRKADSVYISARVDYDARLRTSCRITGTETGRSSTSILEPPLRNCEMGMAFQTISKHGDIGKDIGLMFIPDEGYVFVKLDLSQAEARIVAVLSEDWELLKAFDVIDVHRRTAGLAFDYIDSLELDRLQCSIPKVDQFEKDGPERFIGKKGRHSANYDVRKKTFSIAVTSDCKRFGIKFSLSEWKAGQILDKIHAASPKIKNIFHRQIQECLDNTRTLINPFGRIRTFYGRYGEDLFREGYATIPQSTVHDRMCYSWLKLEREMSDIKVYMESHDSLLFQMRPDEVNDRCKVIKPLFEEPIDFSLCSLKRNFKLVIPCDLEIGENLANFKKFKIENERAA